MWIHTCLNKLTQDVVLSGLFSCLHLNHEGNLIESFWPWHCVDDSLETTLRNFSCLTVGDNIMVAYNNKKYYIDIIESKPAPAISIIETDCEVDFAPPLDYKEPERLPPPPAPVAAPSSQGLFCLGYFMPLEC